MSNLDYHTTKNLIEARYNLNGDENSPVLLEGMTRQEMYFLFAQAGFKRGAEIGVQRGRNAWLMFQCVPDLYLYLIDPYRDHESNPRKWGQNTHDKFKIQAFERLAGNEYLGRRKWLYGFSEEVAGRVEKESLDFVYMTASTLMILSWWI